MPNRILRDWTTSERMAGVSAEAERLFVRLLMKADDFGRFEGAAKLIRSLCFPAFDDPPRLADVESWINELENAGLVARYTALAKYVLVVPNFGQRTRANDSKFPPPEGYDAKWLPDRDFCAHGDGVRSNDRKVRSNAGLDGDGDGDGGGSKEGKPLYFGEVSDSPAPTPEAEKGGSDQEPVTADPALLTFETIGPVKEWSLTQREVDRLAAAFPGVDVLAEARRALAWIEADDGRRKTARGMKRFLTGWVSRSVDRGTAARAGRKEGGDAEKPAGAGAAVSIWHLRQQMDAVDAEIRELEGCRWGEHVDLQDVLSPEQWDRYRSLRKRRQELRGRMSDAA